MLEYLVLTTRTSILMAIILGVVTGYVHITAEKRQRRTVTWLVIAGFVASAVISYFMNATNYVDTAILNGIIYAVGLVAFILFIIVYIISTRKKESKLFKTLKYIFIGFMLALIVAYGMPDVWAYPYHMLLLESTVLSTDFLLELIGMIFALILVVVTFFAANGITKRVFPKEAAVMMFIMFIINAALRMSGLFSVLFQKKIVISNHIMFQYTVFVKNNSDIFIFIAIIVLIVAAIVMFVRSVKQKEPFKNPAEHRIIRAKWRLTRRWAVTVLITGILGILTLTYIDKISQTEVVLSPIEEATAVDDENVYVDFSLVDDGHLHRFAYTTENDVQIRFIVIKKPNSSSYGIGLDACDVCGETGYYERDGQVVCNLCDVVMNISTIGFKGGCNPIVIPYEIENGQIIVPISGLVEYESEFK